MGFAKITILFATLLNHLNILGNVFLTAPRTFTDAEIVELQEEREKNLTMDFTWGRGSGTAINYFYRSGKPGLAIKVAGVPVYFYNYGCFDRCKAYLSKFLRSDSFADQSSKSYYFAEPLKFDNPNPQALELDQLVTMLNGKNFVFYTGAGISIAAGVPSMLELERRLKLDGNMRDFLKIAILHPKALAQAFEDFLKSALRANPTPAHYVIAKIAKDCKTCILTENIDILQHKAGVEPLFSRALPVWEASADDFKQLDFIICVGLSHDDCGLLAHYKKCHPEGRIVAINLGVPDYLSAEDYLVQGDLQQILAYLVLNF